MTPDLALSLSFEGIALRHRTSSGWVEAGTVALDADDLGEDLRALCATARALAGDGFTTEVVLPDDQILYRHLPDVADDRAAVARALDGLTPYAVAELVFDWQVNPEGGVVVAAVARETLDEAEGFARQHGFNPVRFTASPGADQPFAGAPDFGPVAGARAVAGADATATATGEVTDPDVTDPVPADLDGADAPGAASGMPAPVDPDAGPGDPDREATQGNTDGAVAEAARFASRRVTADGQDRPAPLVLDMPLPGDGADGQAGAAGAVTDSVVTVVAALPTRLGGTLLREAGAGLHEAATDGPAEAGADGVADAPAVDAPGPDAARVTADPGTVDGGRAPDDGGSAPRRIAGVVDPVVAPDDPEPAKTPEVARGTEVRGEDNGAVAAPPVQPPLQPPAPPVGGAAGAAEAPVLGRPVAPPRKGAMARPASGARPGPGIRRPGEPKVTGSAGRVQPPAGAKRMVGSKTDRTAAASGTRLAEATVAARTAGDSLSARTLGAAPGRMMAGGTRALASAPVALGLVVALLVALAVAVGLSRVVVGWLAPPEDLPTVSAAAPMIQGETGDPQILPVPETAAEAGTAAPSALPEERAAEASQDAPVVVTADDGQPPGTGVAASADAPTAAGDDPAPGDVIAATPDPTGDVALPTEDSAVAVEDGVASDVPAAPADPATAQAQPALAATEPSPAGAGGFAAPQRPVPPPTSDGLPTQPSAFVLGPGPAPVADPPAPAPVGPPAEVRFTLAALDAALTLQDPLVLPAPVARGSEADLPLVQPPPPAGVVYRLDARGLVIATPEGALAPDGHRVVLGRPAVIAPPRPGDATAAAPVTAEVDGAADGATPPLDPELQRLAALRPPPRPAPPAPLDAGPDADGALLDGAAPVPGDATADAIGAAVAGAAVETALPPPVANLPEAASRRPPLRPQALAALSGVDPDGTDRFAGATAQAVAVSRRPVTRPDGLDALAAAASVRVAPLPPAEAPAAEADSGTDTAAAPAPGDEYADGEPETASVAPSIPTSASVARQATVEGALNLREINLVGVFGTSSDRSALIRMPNGRFVKVGVGDRVDGGRVADIGDSDLRYIKGGRSIVLSMPRG